MKTALLSLLVLAGACGQRSAQTTDAGVPDLNCPTCYCTDNDIGDAGLPGTWDNVQTLIDNNCANGVCHYACRPLGGGGTDCFRVPGGTVGLVLEHGQAYQNMVNQVAPDPPNQCGGKIVNPFHPEQSYLMFKLATGFSASCNQVIPQAVSALPAGSVQCNPNGSVMPRGEPISCPLANCQIDIFRRWIQAGAQP